MKFFTKAICSLGLFLMANVSSATVLDFNNAPNQYWISSYSESGFTVSLAVAEGLGTITEPVGYWNGNGTGRVLTWSNNSGASGFQLTNNGGAHFSLNSFDFGNGYVAGNNDLSNIIVTGLTGAGGTVTADVAHPGLGIFTYTFGSGWSDLQSVTFAAQGWNNRTIFDNIVVNEASVEVPEPTTWAVLAFGLLALAFVRRKQA